MGANLVAQVLTSWAHLPDRPFRVLVRMALTALDKPQNGHPAHVYFAGWELLALTLRSDGGTEQSRKRAIARAVSDLIDEGAIERADAGRTGHKAVYRLTLKGRDGAKKNADQGGLSGHPDRASKATNQGGLRSHPQGGLSDHPKGDSGATNRVASETTPRNQEEPLEELYEEEGVEVATVWHPPRVRSAESIATVVQLFPNTTRTPRQRRTDDTLAEAATRRRAAEAAHRAQTTPEVS